MTGGTGGTRLLLSAGRGPAECAWAVERLAARLEAEAGGRGVGVRRVETEPGPVRGTYRSVVLELTGQAAGELAQAWSGTLCWQAVSPYRPRHPRKNWFVVARRLDPQAPAPGFAEADVEVVGCRTGGPGGQHRNKVSTAVRATHRPTGTVVVVDGERQFSANRRAALDLLRRRLEEAGADAERRAATDRWRTHDSLVRGDATRTERP